MVNWKLPEEQCALNKPVNTFYSQEEIFSLKHGKVIKQLKGIHSLDIPVSVILISYRHLTSIKLHTERTEVSRGTGYLF